MIINVLDLVSQHITVPMAHVILPVTESICKPSLMFLLHDFYTQKLTSIFFVIISKLFKKQIVRFNHPSAMENFLKGSIKILGTNCFTFPYFEDLCDIFLLFDSFVF